MKTIRRATVVLVVITLAVGGPLLAGDLTPPGAPGPTMHTLDELYQKLLSLDEQLKAQTELINLMLYMQGANMEWLCFTVDSGGSVGQHTSLAFGPEGQPAISYYDFGNGDLKFARYTGSAWTTVTVDSTTGVGAIYLACVRAGWPARHFVL